MPLIKECKLFRTTNWHGMHKYHKVACCFTGFPMSLLASLVWQFGKLTYRNSQTYVPSKMYSQFWLYSAMVLRINFVKLAFSVTSLVMWTHEVWLSSKRTVYMRVFVQVQAKVTGDFSSYRSILSEYWWLLYHICSKIVIQCKFML